MDLYLNAEVQRLRAMVDELSAMITMTREEVMNRELNMGLDLPAQVEEAASPPHPFQIIVESPTTFRVNEGWLHMPGMALFVNDPAEAILQGIGLTSTDITTISGYDTEASINIYLKVDYQLDGSHWKAVDVNTVASTDYELNQIDETYTGPDGVVFYFIGSIPLTDGEIDGAPTQYIRSDFAETITGVYVTDVPPPD